MSFTCKVAAQQRVLELQNLSLRKSYKTISNFHTSKRALTGVQRAKTVVLRGFGTHLRAIIVASMV